MRYQLRYVRAPREDPLGEAPTIADALNGAQRHGAPRCWAAAGLHGMIDP